MAKAAFIGLGVMGYPMAGYLKTITAHPSTWKKKKKAE